MDTLRVSFSLSLTFALSFAFPSRAAAEPKLDAAKCQRALLDAEREMAKLQPKFKRLRHRPPKGTVAALRVHVSDRERYEVTITLVADHPRAAEWTPIENKTDSGWDRRWYRTTDEHLFSISAVCRTGTAACTARLAKFEELFEAALDRCTAPAP